jgi:SHOCT-like domain
MAADPLDEVLRLVAEGRLTADEAAPILAALDEAQDAVASAGRARTTATDADRASAAPREDEERLRAGSPSSVRIEVRDNGRNVVNLRLPIAVGRFALDRVPGLSGEQVSRVREAMNSGFRGPVLVVDDGDSGVRIVLE